MIKSQLQGVEFFTHAINQKKKRNTEYSYAADAPLVIGDELLAKTRAVRGVSTSIASRAMAAVDA